jgi:hypothetical protein
MLRHVVSPFCKTLSLFFQILDSTIVEKTFHNNAASFIPINLRTEFFF